MKTINLITGMLVLCLLLTAATFVLPAMHGLTLSYLSFSLSIVVALLCIGGLIRRLLRR